MGGERDTAKRRGRDADDPNGNDDEAPPRRELVPLTSAKPQTITPRSRLTDTMFVAHLFATRFQEPQTREKRRAEPGDANASYRKSAKRPPKPGRFLSKKV